MPNWVTNEIAFNVSSDSEMKRIKEFMMSDECEFDFNKLIPMPKELDLVDGGFDGEYVRCYVASLTKEEANDVINLLKNTKDDYYGTYYEKFFGGYIKEMTADRIKWMKEDVEEKFSKFNAHTFVDVGKLYVDNIKNYGCTTWYEWRCKNWGTKWNASDVFWGEYDVSFSTAWSPVTKLIKKLAKKFPNVEMEYYWDAGDKSGEKIFNG